jgi:hypothetical protein
MKTIRFLATCATAVLVSAGGFSPAPCGAQDTEVEVLTRGPLHEAFATAVTFEPKPGPLIGTEPPELIEELPPGHQLEGENVAWIPGYWAWDAEREDFLWISGIWRNLPPDREWVPGYWYQAGGRHQWIAGYWADAAATEVVYLPEPPKPVDSRPAGDPPSAAHTWIPGNWLWVDTRYRWRPGYWEPLRENWTYVPDHYHWTPRGHILVAGYWDHAPVRRGILFAPVHIGRDHYRRPGFRYTPATVISVALVLDHLFVRPSSGGYYFGDYYDPRYRGSGFVASFQFHSGTFTGYDPIYAYTRWSHRGDRDWERRHRDDFEYLLEHRDARPPRSWSGLREFSGGRRGVRFRDRDYVIATPLDQVAQASEEGRRFRPLNDTAREQVATRRKEMQAFRQQRRQLESAPAARPVDKAEHVEKTRLGRSPILGRKAADLSKEDAPPPRREAPALRDPETRKVTPPEGERQKPGDATRESREDKPEMPRRERETQPQRERQPQPQREREVQPQRERQEQPRREREAQPQRERPQPQRREPPKHPRQPETEEKK